MGRDKGILVLSDPRPSSDESSSDGVEDRAQTATAAAASGPAAQTSATEASSIMDGHRDANSGDDEKDTRDVNGSRRTGHRRSEEGKRSDAEVEEPSLKQNETDKEMGLTLASPAPATSNAPPSATASPVDDTPGAAGRDTRTPALCEHPEDLASPAGGAGTIASAATLHAQPAPHTNHLAASKAASVDNLHVYGSTASIYNLVNGGESSSHSASELPDASSNSGSGLASQRRSSYSLATERKIISPSSSTSKLSQLFSSHESLSNHHHQQQQQQQHPVVQVVVRRSFDTSSTGAAPSSTFGSSARQSSSPVHLTPFPHSASIVPSSGRELVSALHSPAASSKHRHVDSKVSFGPDATKARTAANPHDLTHKFSIVVSDDAGTNQVVEVTPSNPSTALKPTSSNGSAYSETRRRTNSGSSSDAVVPGEEILPDESDRKLLLRLAIGYREIDSEGRVEIEVSDIRLRHATTALLQAEPFVELCLRLTSDHEFLVATLPFTAMSKQYNPSKAPNTALLPFVDGEDLVFKDVLTFEWDAKSVAGPPRNSMALSVERALSTKSLPMLIAQVKCTFPDPSSLLVPSFTSAKASHTSNSSSIVSETSRKSVAGRAASAPAASVLPVAAGATLGTPVSSGSSTSASSNASVPSKATAALDKLRRRFRPQSSASANGIPLSTLKASSSAAGPDATARDDDVTRVSMNHKVGLSAIVGASGAAMSPASTQSAVASNAALATTVAPVAEVRIRLKEMPLNAFRGEWYRLTILDNIAAHSDSIGLTSAPINLLKKISRRFGFHDETTVVDPDRQLHLQPADNKRWWRKLLSIRSILLALLFVQLVIAVAVAVAITYTAAKEQALKIASNLMTSISTSIFGELTSLFRAPLATVMMAVSTLQFIQPANSTKLAHALWSGFSLTDPIENTTLLYCGTPSGLFVGAGRADSLYNNTPFISIIPEQNVTTLMRSIYGISTSCQLFNFNCEIYNASNALVPASFFNTTARSWYIAGAAATSPIWTSVYPFAIDSQLGISAVAPVRNPLTNELLYVAAVDLLLKGISEYMSTLALEGGTAFLLEANTSYLVATSNGSPLAINGTRVIAQQSTDPTIAFVSQSMYCLVCGCDYPNPYDWDCTQAVRYVNNSNIFVTTLSGGLLSSVQAFVDEYGLNFVLLIAIPETSFTSDIKEALQVAIGASVAIIVASVVFAFLVVTLVTHQLQRTTKRLREFANMNFTGGVRASDIASPIKEVSRVSAALLNMRASLRSFSKYVPLEVVRFLSNRNMEASLGGDRRYITIFFSDIADFTKISEKLELDLLIELIGEYLEEMSNIVNAHSGMVDKYIGDAVMALWNVPVPVESHPVLACKAALACHRRLAELRTGWIERGFPSVHARIGIHSGEAITGNFGSKGRLNYTAIGDSVNLASRLEGLNKSYGTYLMISQETHNNVKDIFLCRPLDQVAVKGKAQPIVVYELICYHTEASEEVRAKAELFTEAFGLYLQRKFMDAKARFEKYLELVPGDLAATMQIENCVTFMGSGGQEQLVRVMHEK